MRPEVPESGTVNSLGVLEPNPDFLAALQADRLCLPLGWGLRIWFSASSPGDAIGWSLSGFSPPVKQGPRRCTVRGLVTRASLVDLQISDARRWLHRATLRRDLVRTKGRAGCEKWMETYPGTKALQRSPSLGLKRQYSASLLTRLNRTQLLGEARRPARVCGRKGPRSCLSHQPGVVRPPAHVQAARHQRQLPLPAMVPRKPLSENTNCVPKERTP